MRTLLREQFPTRDDISDEEMLAQMDEVLRQQSSTPGKLPCTLLVLDELQQFIDEDAGRTLPVQDVVEACCSRFGSRLLFVATGQSALQGTPQLQKLQGRFTVRVMLSDSDVERVVRKVVLQKRPDRVPELKRVLESASGEIDRQLAGTKIAPSSADERDLVADYPLLPARRRFWEALLRAIDVPGTAAQLRTQLRIVHDAAAEVVDQPLGSVVPGDFIYDQLKGDMLESAVLLRDTYTLIENLAKDGADGRLRARLCAAIFLISKLEASTGPAALGIQAKADTLADLLVEDLTAGSTALRQRIPAALQALVGEGRLMLIDDVYRLQTRESAEWESEYRTRRGRIAADDARIAGDRATAIQAAVREALKGMTITQGVTRTARRFDLYFGADQPKADTGAIPVWIRDEWAVSERTAREDAQEAGPESPIVFVFLPRRDAEPLKDALAAAAAATETVQTRARPATPEGENARAAMESRARTEAERVKSLVGTIVAQARVFQGGGNEVQSSPSRPRCGRRSRPRSRASSRTSGSPTWPAGRRWRAGPAKGRPMRSRRSAIRATSRSIRPPSGSATSSAGAASAGSRCASSSPARPSAGRRTPSTACCSPCWRAASCARAATGSRSRSRAWPRARLA